jgi:hypothetical protein
MKKSTYGFQTDAVITTSNIPNPGVSNLQKGIAAVLAAKTTVITSAVMLTWPTFIPLSMIWGPGIIGCLTAGAVLLSVRVRKSPTRMAIDEFAHLGIAPEVIGSVIVENRAKAWLVLGYQSQFAKVQEQTQCIGDEVLAIIDGFKDDTSDINRCRHVVSRCLTQTLKILGNLEVIEKRLEAEGSIQIEDFQETVNLATDGLTKLADALKEQHQRNMDNNQNELEIDLEVADILLQ